MASCSLSSHSRWLCGHPAFRVVIKHLHGLPCWAQAPWRLPRGGLLLLLLANELRSRSHPLQPGHRYLIGKENSGNLRPEPQRTGSVGFAACWWQKLPSQEGRECLGPQTGLLWAKSGSLCFVLHQSCILKHNRSTPALQLFKDLDDIHPGPQDVSGVHHSPLSHPTIHVPPTMLQPLWQAQLITDQT